METTVDSCPNGDPLKRRVLARGGRPLAVRLCLAAALLAALLSGAVAALSAQVPRKYLQTGRWTGDLPELRGRGIVRALVSSNQTNYFITEDLQEYGFEYELLKQYEKYLNRKRSRKRLPITVVFVPVPFNKLLPGLLEGRGDIAAAGLTITPERSKRVRFSTPYLPDVSEIVVSNKKSRPLRSVESLSGRRVYVLRGSSYAEHLRAINRRLRRKGLRRIAIEEADPSLQTEDILEMVNAEIIEFTVADDHIAGLWAQVLPNLVLHPDVKVNAGGRIAWALRPDSPELLGSVDRFMRRHKQGTLMGNVLFRRYFENVRWIQNPLDQKERRKLERLVALFRKYGERYGFDWLLIAAQAYQESKLDQNLVSPAGAIGVMQVLPETAASPGVNVRGIRKLENNIHAGVKYLRHLEDTYFSDSDIPPASRLAFAHAAYNAGPAKVQQMRELAGKMGLDPNRWFGNVEQAALRLVGRETVRYVANIRKYYIAYKLTTEKLDAREAQKEALKK